jgi:Ca2+-binding RTX toxin-like protein
MKRPFLILLLGCAGALALEAQPAVASTISSTDSGRTLEVSGRYDPVHDLKIGLVPGNPADYRITDSAANIGEIPFECRRETQSSVRCPSASVASIRVILSGGGDTFSVPPDGIPEGVKLFAWGGEGPDLITGRPGAGSELLSGEEDDDTLRASCPAANKTLKGGTGNDTISICGANTSTSSFLAASASALTAASAGAVLVGAGGNDRITGGPSSDRINAGPGNDVARGGAGKDIIDCGPGKHDIGIGGPGRDLGRLCERVKS